MKRFLLLILISAPGGPICVGQSALNLPTENADKAKEQYVLMKDNYNQGNYHKAYHSLRWILDNAPELHESIYVFGQKILKELIELEPDSSRYKNELMDIYDKRISLYGNELKVLNRKAFDAYKYFRDDRDKLAGVVDMFDYLHSMEGREMADHLIFPYFDLKLLQFKYKDIDEQQLINAYESVTGIIEYKSAQGNSKMDMIRNTIDARLVETIELNCERIRELFANSSDEANADLEQSKLIIKLSLNYKCTGEDYFVNALKKMFEVDPSVKIANLIASWHLEQKQYSEAHAYFEKSKKLTKDPQELSEVFLSIARIYSSQGDKISARKAAKTALQYHPENLQAYNLIGDLYFNSYEECKEGISRVQDRSVFFAAYEKYALAKDRTRMAMAEQQFPTMEEIHQEVYTEGQVITSICWTDEKVRIRRRPNYTAN